jgi:selenocysteine-specific elongation factor SelB
MGSVDRISYIIGTAGHIDHGKTALVGALTGIDTDRLAEEKRRGVSIDLGFAYIDFPTPRGVERAAIVDVPGHERFIRNMLAGITGIDLVLFVVAADDGVMPQTREHLDIIHILGITDGIFVITKTDLVGEERADEVALEITALALMTTLKDSPVVHVSAATGDGIDDLKLLLGERLRRGAKGDRGFFRLPVDRSFPMKGFGTVVTGTVAAGVVSKGDELMVFPTGAKVKVRGIQSLYAEVGSVSAGQRAALNLTGVSYGDIRRGDMLASLELSGYVDAMRAGPTANAAGGGAGRGGASSHPSLRVDCSFEFVERPGRAERAIKNHSLMKLHHLTGEVVVRVRGRASFESPVRNGRARDRDRDRLAHYECREDRTYGASGFARV